MLPVCVKPYSDELLYGWLVRLMEYNGLPNMRAFQSLYFHVGDEVTRATGKTRLDWIPGMERTCQEYEKIKSFPDVETMIERMTGTLTVFPFLSYGNQAMRSQTMLRSEKIYKISLDSDVEQLCVCPQCMSEDRKRHGEAYYHTWHHLSGVRVCAVHRIPLKALHHNGRETLEDSSILETSEELHLPVDIETECAISCFMKEMYERPPMIDLRELQVIMKNRMESLGYSSEKPYGKLPADIRDSGFAGFFGKDIAGEIRRIQNGSWVGRERIIALLVFLFRQYDDFYVAAQKASENAGMRLQKIAAKKGFSVISSRGWLVHFQCLHCDRQFRIHPYALTLGCGCPECDAKLSETEFIKRQMTLVGNGQYEPTEPCRGYGKKIRIRHKTCGKERFMRSTDLIWFGRECKCKYDVTMEKLQARIDPGGREYKLIRYHGKWGVGQMVTIQHKTCGRTFDVQLSYFVKNPYCRACRPRNYSTERFRQDMRALTGDEYTVVGEFVDQTTKIKIMHKKCGTYTDGLPADFLNGKRCSLCSKSISEEDIKRVVKECTESRYSVSGRDKTDFIIADPRGKKHKMTARKIMQELIRPTPSKFFPDRVCQAEVPIRTAAAIYIEGKVICKKQSKFSYRDFQMYSRTDFSNAVKWLIKQKYVKHVEYGKYMTLLETKEKNI